MNLFVLAVCFGAGVTAFGYALADLLRDRRLDRRSEDEQQHALLARPW